MLKGKLGHTDFKNLFEQKLIKIGQHQTGSGLEPSTDRSWRETYREEVEAKQGDHLIGSSLSHCLIWESQVGCDWLSLGFDVLTLRHL